MDETAYLIQGLFFQNRQYLGRAYVPIDGAVTVIGNRAFRDMFAGVIHYDPHYGWSGWMHDQFGESVISNVIIRETELRFTKQYDGRDDAINYTFTLEDGVWVGEFKGPVVGRGKAICLLTPAPGLLFDT